MGIGQTPATIGTQSVSGPAQASKPAPSVEYSPSKLGEGPTKTVSDGSTTVKSSTGGESGNDDISRGARNAYFQQHGEYPPCINTSCRSYGRSHPNCLCYGNHSDAGDFYAKGGEVCTDKVGHHEKCEHYASGGEIAQNEMIHNDPQSSLDHVALDQGLLGLLTKVGNSKSPNPHKQHHDYIDNVKKGHKTLKTHTDNLWNKHSVDHDPKSVDALESHLQDLRENPEKMLDIGGSLNENLPHHAVQLAAQAGTSVQYLNSLKPQSVQANPLDSPIPPDKIAESNYRRQLAIAQNPLLIMQNLKEGTLRPQDVTTLHTIYPGLNKSMGEKIYEQIVDAKQKGIEIPYKQKQSMSLLLGQPLDASMTVSGMQAIINSAGGQQAKQKAQAQPKTPKKATSVELKQINKVNAQGTTDLEDRALDKRK